MSVSSGLRPQLRLQAGEARADVCRDAVKPWHKGNPTNLFGLAPKGKPRLVKSGRAGRHVLVCAPSNSALDELLGRLLSAGIFNRCVARCQGMPWMLGPNHRQHL